MLMALKTPQKRKRKTKPVVVDVVVIVSVVAGGGGVVVAVAASSVEHSEGHPVCDPTPVPVEVPLQSTG